MNVNRPYLSVVAVSRNDDHGKDLLKRMQIFCEAFLAQCNRHGLAAELILVEWNPPSDRPKLATALKWPEQSGPCVVRIVEVPPEAHAKYACSGQLPLFQMIGKNVGIARARGEYVLCTNIDVLFSDELVRFLAAKQLSRGHFYRIDRWDVDKDVPVGAPVEEQLAYCERHVLRVCVRGGTKLSQEVAAPSMAAVVRTAPESAPSRDTPMETPPIFVRMQRKARRRWGAEVASIRAQAPHLSRSRTNQVAAIRFCVAALVFAGARLAAVASRHAAAEPPCSTGELLSSLHTNACGDFTMMHRDHWEELFGYAEFEMYSLHIDSLTVIHAAHAGIQQVILKSPMRIYHIEHETGSGWTPDGDRLLHKRLTARGIRVLNMDELRKLEREIAAAHGRTAFNDESWGLLGVNLPERVRHGKDFETVEAADPFQLLAARRARAEGLVRVNVPDWAQPFSVLREKWNRVPNRRAGAIRTTELLRLSDEELVREWSDAARDLMSDTEFAHRGWFHALYDDSFRDKKILDVGSGFAVDSITFAKRGAQVTFLDLVDSNLQVLRRLCSAFGLTNVKFVLLDDLNALRQLERDYDVILALGSLHHAPQSVIKPEVDELIKHLKIGGRWIQLAYPKTRWEREGCMPFDRWGDSTDFSAPWTEWYDLPKLLDLLEPARFDVVLDLEIHNSDFIWFDLLYRGSAQPGSASG